MSIKNFPRYPLAFLPTPIEELKTLTKKLNGPRLLMKRDDQTGLAFGGNKTRKLEYLLADAIKKECDTLVTMGSIQSNHCRQTAAAARKAGLCTELLLRGKKPEISNGNLLLDQLLKAVITWTDKPVTHATLEAFVEEIKKKGAKPYLVPYGGSSPLGALGYVNAMIELDEQLKQMNEKIDYIVCASSSGGTQAGMVVGKALTGFTGEIHGIGVSKTNEPNSTLEKEFTKIANETAALIELNQTFTEADFFINKDYFGEGYAIMGEKEKEAIHLLAKHESVFLDPVYTGRAFAGLIDLIRREKVDKDKTILFWHTGGTPALFAYADQLLYPTTQFEF